MQQATEAALAEALDLRADQARSALKELTTWGLAGRHDASGFRAVVPEVGLDALVRRRQADVEQARIAVGHAFETQRRSARRTDVDSPVEVVTGPAVKLRIRQLVNGVRHGIRRLDRPPHLFGAVNRAEIEQLTRGVSYRVVYARESLELPGYLEENVTPCVEAGERARVAADLPVNMTILDKDLAWLARPENGQDGALTIVYPGGLLEALAGLFEICWKSAVPLHLAAGTGPSIRADDRRLLVLLNAGVSDARAAQSLGMSRRTFYRRLEQLMALTATTSRFQLAAAAARRGWL
ncbi:MULTISPECIES: helix-turn-helix domain-containing protein [Streptosporangium]|uniref:DNA-binding CsgD family transcriptional regulator n=1 Tax=Streptosporangium brasiliense TaxID=47480 RepID=A0ABT9RJM7_9ACTN|nr:helix-turn-helix domain-containing protein [Streptosporangium brasiliense]MDP9869507.1 DNA-binding CsgD family transcriptional regulator [Streptosporangium brasiliense]